MKKIVLGFFLVLINVPQIYLGGLTNIVLYTGTVGYLFLYLGFKELQGESQHIEEITYLTLLLAAVSFLRITVLVINDTAISNLLMLIIQWLSLGAFYFVTYKYILGLKEIEQHQDIDIHADTLFITMLYMAAINLLNLLVSGNLFANVSAFALLAIRLYFCFRVFETFQLYNISKQ